MEHGSISMNMKTEAEDARECTSSGVVSKPSMEFTSAREVCISVLRSHGLLGTGVAPSEKVMPSDDATLSQSCKKCGQGGSPLEMLICDLCEEAFHKSCCNAWPSELPVDEWYCQTCSPKKRESFLQNSPEKPFNTRTYRENISSMLKDEPHTSRVRIDSDFQAEVPDLSSPLPNGHDYFDQPLELNAVVSTSLNGWDAIKSSKPNSIGNWIQCRNEISTSKNVKIVCGKWRRAPLVVAQTDNWDCSCALPWDPVHADCSVPQELETGEITRHLKFLQALESRLAERKRKFDEA